MLEKGRGLDALSVPQCQCIGDRKRVARGMLKERSIQGPCAIRCLSLLCQCQCTNQQTSHDRLLADVLVVGDPPSAISDGSRRRDGGRWSAGVPDKSTMEVPTGTQRVPERDETWDPAYFMYNTYLGAYPPAATGQQIQYMQLACLCNLMSRSHSPTARCRSHRPPMSRRLDSQSFELFAACKLLVVLVNRLELSAVAGASSNAAQCQSVGSALIGASKTVQSAALWHSLVLAQERARRSIQPFVGLLPSALHVKSAGWEESKHPSIVIVQTSARSG